LGQVIFSDYALRVLAAVLFGFLIGFERQFTGHPAGIQTNVLVCLGACLFELIALILPSNDPSRIASQIVTGVGFLGSGIIFKEGVNVRGINTAAAIWCGAAIGILTGAGEIIYAGVATIAVLIINIAFQQTVGIVYKFIKSDASAAYYRISLTCADGKAMEVRGILINHIAGSKLTLTDLTSDEATAGKIDIHAGLVCRGKRKDDFVEKLVAKLSYEQSVSSIKWELV